MKPGKQGVHSDSLIRPVIDECIELDKGTNKFDQQKCLKRAETVRIVSFLWINHFKLSLLVDA